MRKLIYPELCRICLRVPPQPDIGVCEECNEDLPRIAAPHCNLCGGTIDSVLDVCSECVRQSRPWEHGTTVFDFGGLARFVVHQLKYRGNVSLSPFLARAAWDRWMVSHGTGQIDVVTAVPLHWLRKARRGYNQVELVAREFCVLADLPYRDLLKRWRWTRPQSRLSSSERRQNLKKAFAISSRFNLANKRVLLIDDVLTTGSTLAVCSEKLLEAGAASVDIMTVARG